MRDLFINVSDLAPGICIVLFVFRNDASLRSVACNAAKQALPKARYRCPISDERGGKAGAFDRANLCFRVGRDLPLYFVGSSESLFEGSMQPPVLSPADQGRTPHLEPFGQIA